MAKKEAKIAPAVICPSPPIFQKRILKHGAIASAHPSRGMAFFRVCLKLDASFGSMAVKAAMLGNKKTPDADYARKIVACPLFKEWKKKNMATLND